MNGSGQQQPTLDWQVMREIWQLAPSDRRRLASQFSFLDRSGLIDDTRFYSAVLERMQADPDYCQVLEKAFQTTGRDKDVHRSFARRAWRWLERRIDSLHFADGLWSPPPETFPPVELAVFRLWENAVVGAESTEGAVTALLQDADGELPDDWASLVEALGKTLEAMTRPGSVATACPAGGKAGAGIPSPRRGRSATGCNRSDASARGACQRAFHAWRERSGCPGP